MKNKKQRFVVVSDIHSHFDELIKALDKVNFNKETDFLISLGDNWDRGPKPVEVMQFLMTLPNKILVRGNHCELLEQCCERGYPQMHDYSNGTVDTIRILGDEAEGYTFDECCDRTLARTRAFRNQMVNYFETKNHIFVHSYIALKPIDGMPKHYTRNRIKEYNPDWRNASNEEWNEAMWGNPFMLHKKYGHNFDKTIVCGHWHTSWPRMYFDGEAEMDDDACFDPYYMDGLIGIDGCVAHSGQVNVLVIEDDFLEKE